MPEFLRDPVWQFIGAVFGAAALFAMVWFYLREKRRKALSYRILSNVPLVQYQKEYEDRLTIFFDEVRVHDLHLVVIEVVNSGDIPIEASDFVEPLQFSFGEQAVILGGFVTQRKPSYLSPSVETIPPHTVRVNPLLMNPGDSFQLVAQGTRFDSELDAKARIVGVSDLTSQKAQPQRRSNWILGLGIVIGLAGGSILLSLSGPEVSTGQAFAMAGFGIFAGLTAGLVVMFLWPLYLDLLSRSRDTE